MFLRGSNLRLNANAVFANHVCCPVDVSCKMANDRLRALEDVEKEIAVVLQCAGFRLKSLSDILLKLQLVSCRTSFPRV